MQLENCVYDFFELTTLNMAQQGVFGEILHVEGAYIHNLEDYWSSYWNNWRMDYNRNNRGMSMRRMALARLANYSIFIGETG